MHIGFDFGNALAKSVFGTMNLNSQAIEAQTFISLMETIRAKKP